MSFLFIVLAVFGLALFITQRAEGKRDYFIVAFVLIVAMCLAACGGPTQATPTSPAPTQGSVHWGATYAPQSLTLTLTVQGHEDVHEVTMYLSHEVDVVDYIDLCVPVAQAGTPEVQTWFALPHGKECVLRSPSSQGLRAGQYTLTLEFRLKRDMWDASLDKDMTPKVTDCKVTHSVDLK